MSGMPGNEAGDDGRPGALWERAYRSLHELLVTLDIPPGAPINEERLCRALGIGRTPVREALKRLETEQLVAIYPRRGTFATEINITDHALIADVRQQLEAHAARRAAELRTGPDRAVLVPLLARVVAAADSGGEPAELMHLDTEVHQVVYRCSHNRYLESTLSVYYSLALRIWYLFIDRLGDVAAHIGEHAPLLEAILAGDPEAAHGLAAAHVVDFERTILVASRGITAATA